MDGFVTWSQLYFYDIYRMRSDENVADKSTMILPSDYSESSPFQVFPLDIFFFEQFAVSVMQ